MSPAGGVAVIARGMKSSAVQTRHWVRGFAQIFRLPDGAVRNSYPKLDLPWENVIAGPWENAGPWGWPRSTVLAQVPARHPPCDGSGRLRYAKRVNFQLRNATPH